MDEYKNDIKLDQNSPPLADSISSISWAYNIGPIFAATSWDGSLKIYEVSQAQFGPSIIEKVSYKFQSPLTKCCWNYENNQIYFGAANGMVKSYDVNSGNVLDVGKHNAGVSSLHVIPGQNTVISTGYENFVHFWQNGNPNPIYSVDV
jgi:mRNA export factor